MDSMVKKCLQRSAEKERFLLSCMDIFSYYALFVVCRGYAPCLLHFCTHRSRCSGFYVNFTDLIFLLVTILPYICCTATTLLSSLATISVACVFFKIIPIFSRYYFTPIKLKDLKQPPCSHQNVASEWRLNFLVTCVRLPACNRWRCRQECKRSLLRTHARPFYCCNSCVQWQQWC